MMAGDLPPSSSVTGVRLRPAASATSRPTRVEPVKIRWSNGSAAKALRDLVVDAGHEHLGGVEFRRDHFLQQRGKPRHQFARLDHHPVAGGERADRRRQRQLQRIIPRRDDADHAERLRDQAIFGRHELQRGRDPLRRHPFLQMLCGVLDLAEHQ